MDKVHIKKRPGVDFWMATFRGSRIHGDTAWKAFERLWLGRAKRGLSLPGDPP